MRDLVVQTAGDADLGPLTAAIGDNGFFPDWPSRQHDGRGQLLVALLSGRHVGTIYLWLEDADETPIREICPAYRCCATCGWRGRTRANGSAPA
jgi:hypothetical protein